MTAFYVGQRVRIVKASAIPEALGREARIVAVSSGPGDWQLDIDGLSPAALGCPAFYARSSSIEPIVDDGRQVISWSECLWQPEGIAA